MIILNTLSVHFACHSIVIFLFHYSFTYRKRRSSWYNYYFSTFSKFDAIQPNFLYFIGYHHQKVWICTIRGACFFRFILAFIIRIFKMSFVSHVDWRNSHFYRTCSDGNFFNRFYQFQSLVLRAISITWFIRSFDKVAALLFWGNIFLLKMYK